MTKRLSCDDKVRFTKLPYSTRFKEMVRAKSEVGLLWSNWERLAALAAHIDFGCDFKDGICKAYRAGEHPNELWYKPKLTKRNIKQCCCIGCAGCDGNYGTLN